MTSGKPKYPQQPLMARMDYMADRLQAAGLQHLATMLDSVSSTIEKSAAVEFEGEIRLVLRGIPEEVKAAADLEDITQGFISKTERADVRIRRTVVNASPAETRYTLTAKYRPLSQESETALSKEMFEDLWKAAISRQHKLRYKWNGWDIDVFDDGKIVAEYEYPEGSKTVVVPPELAPVVTGGVSDE